MIIDNNYVVLPENAEEVKASNEVILKLREEKHFKELISKHTTNILLAIGDSIGELGLAETKRIVRELNRNLREHNGTDV